MKHFIAVAVMVSMLTAVGFVQAKGKGGKGPSGIQGTISTVGSSGFAMTTDDGKKIKVLCNANTKFMSGNDKASATDIKEGVKVSIQGSTSGESQVTATVVTIMPSKKST